MGVYSLFCINSFLTSAVMYHVIGSLLSLVVAMYPYSDCIKFCNMDHVYVYIICYLQLGANFSCLVIRISCICSVCDLALSYPC